MMNHVNSQIKNRRRNTVIARGKIINIDYSWGEIDFVSRPLQEMSLRCCELQECESTSYDMDIEPDDIDISDTVTVIWGLED